jgi:nucleotide-binding universal stress UspA family protein
MPVSDADNNRILEAFVDEQRPVLVAVDFSEDSRAAVLWASAFAARVGGRLVLLHVVHDPADQPGYYRSVGMKPPQTMEQAAAGMLDDFVARLKAEHPELATLHSAEHKLLSGLPPGRIAEAAELLHARLIVIGSRGMTGLPHLLQGSVSERVVELANGPVVVIKAEENQRIAAKKRKQEKKQKKKREKQQGKQSTSALRSPEDAAQERDVRGPDLADG